MEGVVTEQNNYVSATEILCTFNRSSFRHFVLEVNEIVYPGRGIIKLVRYQISVQNGEMISD